MSKLISFIFLFLLSINSFSSDLKDAIKMQNQVYSDAQNSNDIDKRQETTKKVFAKKRDKQFYNFFKEVKNSGLKLIDPQIWIDKMNTQRKRSGSCCQIYVAEKLDGGLFVNFEDQTAFSIDGYGLISSVGIIHDGEFEKSGKISGNCKYEVNISYNNSREYSCIDYVNGRLDSVVVTDMKEMLIKAMQDYRR